MASVLIIEIQVGQHGVRPGHSVNRVPARETDPLRRFILGHVKRLVAVKVYKAVDARHACHRPGSYAVGVKFLPPPRSGV